MLSETQESYTNRHPHPVSGINPIPPKPRPPEGQEYAGIFFGHPSMGAMGVKC